MQVFDEKRGVLNEIGALWEKTDKNGNTYLTGKVNDDWIVVFKNRFKETDKQPEFRIYRQTPKEPIKDGATNAG